MKFNERIKTISRVRDIIFVLLKYGFKDIVAHTSLAKFIPERSALHLPDKSYISTHNKWERIRMVIEELGPSFIKMGQILSSQADLIPTPLIKELEKLQDQVSPCDKQTIIHIIEKELNVKSDSFFHFFSPQPIGTASIGQVHKARLKNGVTVAVKVQRPHIESQIETDIYILEYLSQKANTYFQNIGITHMPDMIDLLKRITKQELNYLSEMRHINRFKSTYVNNEKIYIPQVYKKWCTSKVLIYTYVRGIKITDVKKLIRWNLNPQEIIQESFRTFLKQVFEKGFFHADLHPGNIIIKKQGTICLIDFGMVGKLMPYDRIALANMFYYMANQNMRNVVAALKNLSVSHRIKDEKTLERQLYNLSDIILHADTNDSPLYKIALQLQEIVYEHHIRIPQDVFLVLRGITLLEGIGKKIDPYFDAYTFINQEVKQIFKYQHPQHLKKEFTQRLFDLDNWMHNLPIEMNTLIGKIRRGDFVFQIKHTGSKKALKKIDELSTKLIIAFLIGSFFIGASISATTDFPISKWGIPLTSLIGYGLSGVLLLILLFWLSKRHKNKE